MAAITIRGLSDDTHRALKERAARHHRSTEAEVRAILDQAVEDERPPLTLGALFARVREATGGVDLEIQRDKTPHEPIDLS